MDSRQKRTYLWWKGINSKMIELQQTLMCLLPVDIVSGVNGKQIKQLAKLWNVIHGVKQQLFLNCTI